METTEHTKDWLANLASSTTKENMRKNQPWRCLCFGSAFQNHTDDTITLNDFAVTA